MTKQEFIEGWKRSDEEIKEILNVTGLDMNEQFEEDLNALIEDAQREAYDAGYEHPYWGFEDWYKQQEK